MNTYRETRQPMSDASGAAYRLHTLTQRMAATDDPEEIVAFELAIEEVGDAFNGHVANIMDTAADLRITVEGIDYEIARLQALKMERTQRAERLESAVRRYMENLAIPEIVTDLYTLRLKRNPPAVEISEEPIIPEEFRRVQVVEKTSIDKKAIAEALKAGIPVPGAALIQRTRLEVK